MHTDRAPIEESVYQFWSKTGKNGRTYGATGVDLLTIFFYRHGKLELCVFFLHTFSQATARGQDEFLLISILLSYLFAFFVNQFSYYTFCKNEIVASLFSVCFIRVQERYSFRLFDSAKKIFLKFET